LQPSPILKAASFCSTENGLSPQTSLATRYTDASGKTLAAR